MQLFMFINISGMRILFKPYCKILFCNKCFFIFNNFSGRTARINNAFNKSQPVGAIPMVFNIFRSLINSIHISIRDRIVNFSILHKTPAKHQDVFAFLVDYFSCLTILEEDSSSSNSSSILVTKD